VAALVETPREMGEKPSSLQAMPQINKSETLRVEHRIFEFKTPQAIPTFNCS